MDNAEALQLLREAMEPYRDIDFHSLEERVGSLEAREVTGASGRSYQVEMQVLWDSTPGGDIRVLGSVDDGGWRAFLPLSLDFIIHHEGRVSSASDTWDDPDRDAKS